MDSATEVSLDIAAATSKPLGSTQAYACTECKAWFGQEAREFHARRCARRQKEHK